MGEACPLKAIVAYENGADRDRTQWEPGIPQQCWSCVTRALAEKNPRRQDELFQPELDPEEQVSYDEGVLDLYSIYGIRQLADGSRIAIQETGIDDDGWNEGGLISRVVAPIECPNE